MKDRTDREAVGQRLWLILLLFNMLVCAYVGRIGWMLFWAIAFSGGTYEYGKSEEQRSSQYTGNKP